jgi:tRNA pseudouridine55 synthase
LGYGGTLTFLLRLRVGPFRLEDALTLEEWEEAIREGKGDSLLLPVQSGLSHLPRIWVASEAARKLSHGQWIRLHEARTSQPPPGGPLRLELPDGRLVAIAEVRGNTLRPLRVFVRPEEFST